MPPFTVARGLRYGRFEMLQYARIRNPIDRIANLSGLFAAVAALTMPLVAGCGDDPVEAADNPPFPPDGVFSVTGDHLVTIYWNPNQEGDLAGYRIYRGNVAEQGPYDAIAEVSANQTSYDDTDVNNGDFWFYAVAAFDKNGHESELSAETVFDTPRPEGFDLVLGNLGQDPSHAGYDFSSLSGSAQSAAANTTDIYFEDVSGVKYIVAKGSGVDIQDYGLIDLIGVDWAPNTGWAPSKQVEAIAGHSYIVRISDGQINYAKFFVNGAPTGTVTLDWAYQTDPGNPELLVIGGTAQ
jgi:hypothetical protein